LTHKKLFVAIAGNIGSGKSTLTQLLSKRLGWQPHFEPVDGNPYLADFYRDMNRWSFPMQVYFLNQRFQIHQKIAQNINASVQDRSIYEDVYIFARNLFEQGFMEERDYKNYLELYGSMSQFLTPPDLVIYLKQSLPTLKSRIESRGRSFEKEIPDEYLSHLNRYYDEWMEHYDFGKKLIVSSDSLDFQDRPQDLEFLVHAMFETLGKDHDCRRSRLGA
jgi:deoxyadenosine/deoxycytidine kinase